MRRTRRTTCVSAVTLPVTPMLDMTFQLLFFLVLTFRPGETEREFKLAFTPTGTGCGPGRVIEELLNEPAPTLTVVVRALPDGSGGISGLLVQSVEGERVLADVAALQVWLAAQRRESTQAGQVRIQADYQLKYAVVIEVVDACHQAGCKGIGFTAPAL